jgi:DeoR/GlpR family transcriptional regulator of sugar metabolism
MSRNSNTISQTQRLEIIRQLLAANGEVLVSKLATEFKVSEMTVRRDIEMLESQGEVLRTHGGAALAKRLTFEFTFKANHQKNLEQKKAIAAAAVKHISDGQVVLLDTGTTTLEIARILVSQRRKVRVITTSLAIVSELQFVDDIETILLGGFLRKGSPDIHGPLTEQNLTQFSCDIAFVGADAFDETATTYTNDLRVLNLDRQMAKAAQYVVVVADSSKFGEKAMCRVFTSKEYNLLITDSQIDKKALRIIKKTGINLELA